VTIAGVRINPRKEASPAPAAVAPQAEAPSGPFVTPPPPSPAEAAPKGSARPGARARIERPTPAANEADVMLWLNQRISTLQEERESRWKKILKLLPGSS
jgi:hypothetical protein